jgi:hypothetical protein
MPKLSIIGVSKNGNGFVLMDSQKRKYDCVNKDELWNDMMAIVGDPALPGAVVTKAQIDNDDELLGEACDQISSAVGDSFGPFWGRLARESSKKVAPFTLKTLRNVSSRDRFGHRKKKK